MNRRPLRILFLADGVFQDLPGGGRVMARELALGLTKRGHQVTFLVPRLKDGTPDDERVAEGRIVRYSGTGQGPGFVRAGRNAAIGLWTESPYDIVHTHFAYAALGPLRALPATLPQVRSFYGPWDQEAWTEEKGRLTQMPAMSRAIHSLAASVKRGLRHQVEAINLRRSRSVIVLSEQSRGEVAEFHYPPSQIRLLSGGVDLSRFRPAPDRGAVRDGLGLPRERRILLSVRRLAARMGLDILIEAMPAVIARHPDALLLIGGKGPEQERLEQMIRDRGLQDHVRLLGFIPDDDLVSYYQAADVFVLPTLALEGFGLVTVEALACGVPVIGTPVGATPEILRPLEPRLVSAAATPEALAESVLAFFDGPWSGDLSADRLRRYICDHFTWDRHTEAVEAIYYDLLSGGMTPETAAGRTASATSR
jgi:glycosyltransferase involved in cell wall biosynthesis